MEGGLDSMLSKLIGLLSSLVDNISWVVDGLKGFKKGLDDVTGGNSLLAVGLALVLGLLTRKRKAVVAGVKSLKTMTDVWSKLKGLLNTGVGRALKLVGGRIFWIISALQALSFVGNQYADHLAGKTSWFSVFLNYLSLASLKLDVFALKFKIMLQEMKYAVMHPIDYSNFISNINSPDGATKTFFGRYNRDAVNQLPFAKNYGKNTPESPAVRQAKEYQAPPALKPVIPTFKNTFQETLDKYGSSNYQRPIQLNIDMHLDGKKIDSFSNLFTSDLDQVIV